jgi:hypothetical protein
MPSDAWGRFPAGHTPKTVTFVWVLEVTLDVAALEQATSGKTSQRRGRPARVMCGVYLAERGWSEDFLVNVTQSGRDADGSRPHGTQSSSLYMSAS